MIKLTPLAIACSYFLLSCSGEPTSIAAKKAQQPNKAEESKPDLSLVEDIKSKEKEVEEFSLLKLEAMEELNSLRLVNQRLCERLFTYRKECPVAARLKSIGNEKVLGCVGNYEDGARLVPKFTVVLETTSGGSFYLSADNAYDSAAFGNTGAAGATLKWEKTCKECNTVPPRVWDIPQLRLRASAGTSRPSLSSITRFEVRVNKDLVSDKDVLLSKDLILDKSDLVEPEGSGPHAYFNLKLDKISAFKTITSSAGGACIVDDEELVDIIDRGREDGKKAAPSLYLEETPAEQKKQQEENAAKKLEALKAEVEQIKAELGNTQKQADRENDRNGKIFNEIIGDRNSGCFSTQKIDTFEMEFSGAHLENKASKLEDPQRIDIGNPRQFAFNFGEQFAYMHSDEEKQAILVPGGRVVLSKEFAGKLIRDIEFVSIEKGGIGWDSVREITNKFFNYSKWRNSEKNIYRLDSLAIKVNGEEFYRADAINFTFKEGKLVWADRNLGLNRAFQRLMRRSDCPAPK